MRDDRAGPWSLPQRFRSLLSKREPPSAEAELSRLEQKELGLRKATDEWLSLLHEMEEKGETSEDAYDRYYEAYLEAKRQQKQAEVSLFNLRHRQAEEMAIGRRLR